jgi:hypothetical protein
LDLFPAGTTDKDRRIDPLPVLGVLGFNVLTSGNRLGLSPSTAAAASMAGKIFLAAALGAAMFVGWAKFMRGRAPVGVAGALAAGTRKKKQRLLRCDSCGGGLDASDLSYGLVCNACGVRVAGPFDNMHDVPPFVPEFDSSTRRK